MKEKIICILLFLILAATNNVAAQKPDFPCIPDFHFYHLMWTDNSVVKIYDSLNVIDFNKEDFELRIWADAAGNLGIFHNVFIMRHFIKKNRWRAFYYSGFTLPSSKHKTMDEFFSDNELKKFKPKIWRLFWDTLVSNNILTLSPPSNDTLEEISYGDKVTSSANVTYIFELIKKDCKRSYRFSMETMSREIFKDLPQFKTVKTLIDLMNRRLTLENSKKD